MKTLAVSRANRSKRLIRHGALISTVCLTLAASASAQIDISNPDNPYDHIGSLHNQGLDYVIEQVSSGNQIQWSPESTMLLVTQHVLDFTAAAQEVESASPYVDMELIATQFDQPDNFKQLMNEMMTQTQKFYYAQISERMEDLTESPATGKATAKLEQFRALETEIFDQMPEDEARPLLIGAAVARYSWFYWSQEILFTDQSRWEGEIGGISPGALRPIASADVDGAIAGAIGGAIAGSLAGGAGVVPGAAAGSVGGALGSSAVAAFRSLFDY